MPLLRVPVVPGLSPATLRRPGNPQLCRASSPSASRRPPQLAPLQPVFPGDYTGCRSPPRWRRRPPLGPPATPRPDVPGAGPLASTNRQPGCAVSVMVDPLLAPSRTARPAPVSRGPRPHPHRAPKHLRELLTVGLNRQSEKRKSVGFWQNRLVEGPKLTIASGRGGS